MVAPNGARRSQSDHPAIPITDDEIVATAEACWAAGAGGLHVHLRDEAGRHLLDAERYRVLLDRLGQAVPEMYLQATSEAAGRYDQAAQQSVVRELKPKNVSVALREMVRSEADWPDAAAFYAWAHGAAVSIHHIAYSLAELDALIAAAEAGRIPGTHHLIQLVLGAYDGSKTSRPEEVAPLAKRMAASSQSFDWMLCAFGAEETACLVEALRLGGKARIGFENSLWHADGSLAKDNAERVTALRAAIAGRQT